MELQQGEVFGWRDAQGGRELVRVSLPAAQRVDLPEEAGDVCHPDLALSIPRVPAAKLEEQEPRSRGR